MNYYRVEVEADFTIDGVTNCSQQTFYLASSNEVDFRYITRLVYNNCGEHHDQIDIFVEKMADNMKF
jgi:hypothetical protein